MASAAFLQKKEVPVRLPRGLKLLRENSKHIRQTGPEHWLELVRTQWLAQSLDASAGRRVLRIDRLNIDHILAGMGVAVEAARLVRGLTQKMLAQALNDILPGANVSQSLIDKSEQRLACSLDNRFGAFALALGLPPSVLVVAGEAAAVLRRSSVEYKDRDALVKAVAGFLRQIESSANDHLPEDERSAFEIWTHASSVRSSEQGKSGDDLSAACRIDETPKAKNAITDSAEPVARPHVVLSKMICRSLKIWRGIRGKTQEQVAEALRKKRIPATRITVSQLECGQSSPSWARLAATACVLRVSLPEVFVTAENKLADQFMTLEQRKADILARLGEVIDQESAKLIDEWLQIIESQTPRSTPD